MGVITDIKIQKRDKNRVSVYVDGKFFTGMQSIAAVKQGLKPGVEIDERQLIECIEESEISEAFEKAYVYAAGAPKTRRQIFDFLKRRQFSEQCIEKAVEKLEEYGCVDDEKYVDAYIDMYCRVRGINRIKADLLSKGVDKMLIDEKLSLISDQKEAAAEAAAKYMRTHVGADKAKLRRYLYSKGFAYSDITDVTGGDDYD